MSLTPTQDPSDGPAATPRPRGPYRRKPRESDNRISLGGPGLRPPTVPHETLLAWRFAIGLTQGEAARALDMSLAKYSRLERRVLFVKGRDAVHLRTVTGVPLEVLVGVV